MESQLWGGMAEIVGGLGASCIHTARDGYQNTKRVQMNSLRAFGGGLMQGNDGKSAMGGVWLRMSAALRFRVSVWLKKNTER